MEWGQSFIFELFLKNKDLTPLLTDKATEFYENSISLKYILVQVNEIGIDKANDIAFISHNTDQCTPPIQKFLVKGERMKYEYAIMLASAYCLSVNADTVYYYRNEDFKWK